LPGAGSQCNQACGRVDQGRGGKWRGRDLVRGAFTTTRPDQPGSTAIFCEIAASTAVCRRPPMNVPSRTACGLAMKRRPVSRGAREIIGLKTPPAVSRGGGQIYDRLSERILDCFPGTTSPPWALFERGRRWMHFGFLPMPHRRLAGFAISCRCVRRMPRGQRPAHFCAWRHCAVLFRRAESGSPKICFELLRVLCRPRRGSLVDIQSGPRRSGGFSFWRIIATSTPRR